MSAVMKRAIGVEMVLLSRILVVVKLAVAVEITSG
jgi:hypothetical protein